MLFGFQVRPKGLVLNKSNNLLVLDIFQRGGRSQLIDFWARAQDIMHASRPGGSLL